MISPEFFCQSLSKQDISFFTGVPDSLLKDICAYVTDTLAVENHKITANEGSAIGLAIGYHISSKKLALVYMQNSGLGNAVNPITSLADKKIYSVPMMLLIGWRGEPGLIDEPQHIKQGEVSESLLQAMDIPYNIISSTTLDLKSVLKKAVDVMSDKKTPYVILVRKDTFKPYVLRSKSETNYDLSREAAIKKVIDLIGKRDIVVATTGKTSREVFEYRKERGDGHEKDFLTVGGMGHTNQIALGIALAKAERTIYCLDGDGAVIMHAGSMGIIGDLAPVNLKHIIFNNGSHDSVGGQPTIGFKIDFGKIAEGFNYHQTYKIESLIDFDSIFERFKASKGPC